MQVSFLHQLTNALEAETVIDNDGVTLVISEWDCCEECGQKTTQYAISLKEYKDTIGFTCEDFCIELSASMNVDAISKEITDMLKKVDKERTRKSSLEKQRYKTKYDDSSESSNAWYTNGRIHRSDGPAIEHPEDQQCEHKNTYINDRMQTVCYDCGEELGR